MNTTEKINKITKLALIFTFAIIFFNSIQISSIESILGSPTLGDSINKKTSSINLLAEKSDVIPTGKPKVYGDELKFSYDDIDPYDSMKANAAIKKFSDLDKSLIVEGKNLDRYIKILYIDHDGMSCEFCCGARSIIFADGKPACGCAHSFAMRGLTKYLLLNHPDMSDEDILSEVGKFKILFFPTIHEAKAQVMKEKNIEYDGVLLTSNAYRGIEKGTPTNGAMVGGC